MYEWLIYLNKSVSYSRQFLSAPSSQGSLWCKRHAASITYPKMIGDGMNAKIRTISWLIPSAKDPWLSGTHLTAKGNYAFNSIIIDYQLILTLLFYLVSLFWFMSLADGGEGALFVPQVIECLKYLYNWMAWCKRDVSDFFRWNFFPSKVPEFLHVLFN